MKRLESLDGTASVLTTRAIKFQQAAVIFDGGEPNPDSVLTKAKCDYVTKPMTEQGILTLFNGLVKAPGEIAVLCEAINKVAADATAFVHRANTKYVMQYYMQWDSA